jgi:hypothetical protein
VIPATPLRSTPARSVRSAVVRGLSLLGFALLAACASPGPAEHYPELSQMPSLPQGVTPAAERQKVIEDLKREAGPTAAKQPAVPPKPAAEEQPTSSLAPADDGLIGACEMDLAAAKPVRLAEAAVPPLRGTLHGNWHAAPAPPSAAPPSAAPPPMVANPPAGVGITGSVAVPAQIGPLVVGFAPGSAELSPRNVAVLKARAGAYILNGGISVSIGARGGALGPAGLAGVKPLAALSLGMKRTSAIADVLVKAGIGAEQIKMSAVGDRDIPALAADDWKDAGPDDAVVVFDIPTP